MNRPVGSPTAIILDDDVAFLLWLGELFHETGYQAFPALNYRQAVTLAGMMEPGLDVFVVNPKLRGANRTIQALASGHPNLRVILIRDPSDLGGAPLADHLAIDRPRAREPISRSQWLVKVRRVLMRAAAT